MLSEQQIAEHPLDQCLCGDYRRDHANDTGACTFNSNKFDACHAFEHCYSFRIAEPYKPEPKP